MITVIRNVLHEVFRFDGLTITVEPNEIRSKIWNGDYYDILCGGTILTTFDLAAMADDYRDAGMTVDEVAAEIIDCLVKIIESKL